MMNWIKKVDLYLWGGSLIFGILLPVLGTKLPITRGGHYLFFPSFSLLRPTFGYRHILTTLQLPTWQFRTFPAHFVNRTNFGRGLFDVRKERIDP